MQEKLIESEKQPLFELCAERPAHWSPAEDVMVSEALGAAASNRKIYFFKYMLCLSHASYFGKRSSLTLHLEFKKCTIKPGLNFKTM